MIKNNPNTIYQTIVTPSPTLKPGTIKAFFLLTDEQRDLLLIFIKELTGLEYIIRRSDPENICSSLMLCLGDVVIMHQDWID